MPLFRLVHGHHLSEFLRLGQLLGSQVVIAMRHALVCNPEWSPRPRCQSVSFPHRRDADLRHLFDLVLGSRGHEHAIANVINFHRALAIFPLVSSDHPHCVILRVHVNLLVYRRCAVASEHYFERRQFCSGMSLSVVR